VDKKREELIYDLIFSEKSDFVIDLGAFVEDIYLYEDFVDDIRSILRRSKVTIAKSSIKVDSKTARWELKIKK
jgi:hypothetical protein